MSQSIIDTLQKTFGKARSLLCVALAGIILCPGPALAGFEYVPTTNASASSSAPAMAAQPASPTPGSDIVQGGADNVPLSVALTQILPTGVGFAPGEGVDMSVPVSWEGGRPRQETLNNVLSSAGLSAVPSGNVLLIHRTTPQVAMTSAPTAPVPAPEAPAASTPAPAPAPVVMQGTEPSPTPAMKFAKVEPAVYDSWEQSGSAGNVDKESPAANVMNAVYSGGSPMGTWTGHRGMTLRTVLKEWSERAGVELFWSAPFDYPIMATINIQGSFEDATNTLLKGFEKASPHPIGRLHKNANMGTSVLVIEALGNTKE